MSSCVYLQFFICGGLFGSPVSDAPESVFKLASMSNVLRFTTCNILNCVCMLLC